MKKLLLLQLLSILLFGKSLLIENHSIIKIPNKKFETSGVTIHPKTKDLVAISDNGKIFIKDKVHKLKKEDFEGITYNQDGSKLFAVIEGEDSIVQFQITKPFKILNKYKIKRKFQGEKVTSKKGDGFESLTFVKETKKHLYFYTANQSKKFKGKDRSAILLIKINKKKKKGEIEDYFPMKIQDISGMFYKNDDEIYFISDTNDMLYKTDNTFKNIKEFSLIGDGQEGIVVDENKVFIAQDSGDILRINLKNKI